LSELAILVEQEEDFTFCGGLAAQVSQKHTSPGFKFVWCGCGEYSTFLNKEKLIEGIILALICGRQRRGSKF
jgi:hypothetical protein